MANGSVRIDLGVKADSVHKDLEKTRNEIKLLENELEKLEKIKESGAISEYAKKLEASLKVAERKIKNVKDQLAKLAEREADITKQYGEGPMKEGFMKDIMKQRVELQKQLNELEAEEQKIKQAYAAQTKAENEELQKAINKIYDRLADLKVQEVVKMAEEGLLRTADSLKSKFDGIKDKVKSFDDALKNAAKNLIGMGKNTNGIGNNFKGAFSSVKRLVLSLIGAQTAMSAINKLVSQWKEQNKELADTISTIWNGLVQLVTPALNGIIGVLATVLNYVLAIIKYISGINVLGFLKNANAKAKKGAGGGGSGNQLYSFDKSETVKQPGGGGTAQTPGLLKDIELNKELMEYAEKLKHIWEDIKQIGRNLVNGIKEGLEYMDSGARILQVGKDLLNAFLDDLIEALDATVEWSDNLNFGPMFDTLASVLESLEPILEKIGDLFVWLWINAVLPLGTWIVETLIPAFNEMLVPALDAINAVLEVLIPILQKIWQEQLVPFFEFIGTTATDLMNWIGEWFAENQQWLTDLTTKLGDVLAFIVNVVIARITAGIQYMVERFKLFVVFIKNIIDDIVLILAGLIQFIVGVFTGDWEGAWEGIKNIFAGIWNGILDITEGVINGIVNAVNTVIRFLNTLHIEIPDWVPEYGGRKFGFNINELQKVNLSGFKVPGLAQGAIIPPNKEFLAMLGDQTRGRNIETPEGLLRDIVREESPQQPITINITGEGDLDALVRMLKFKLKEEDSRIGTALVLGGS